jgi:hypothetical protein
MGANHFTMTTVDALIGRRLYPAPDVVGVPETVLIDALIVAPPPPTFVCQYD